MVTQCVSSIINILFDIGSRVQLELTFEIDMSTPPIPLSQSPVADPKGVRLNPLHAPVFKYPIELK